MAYQESVIAALQMDGTNGSGRVEIASASDTLD
jgi:hypothetical protein